MSRLLRLCVPTIVGWGCALAVTAVTVAPHRAFGQSSNGQSSSAQPPSAGADISELQEVLGDLGRFQQASKDYRGTVDRLVRRAYEARRQRVVGKYDDQISIDETQERTRRVAAITLFEQFLRRYPNDRRWTPDVIFRLAELYFEKSNDKYLMAQDRYEQDLVRFERKEIETPPLPPRQSYDDTIALHRRLIREWPNYRLAGGAYYLLGFCLAEMGELDAGNQAFLSLVCSNRYQPPLEAVAAEEAGKGAEPAIPPGLTTPRSAAAKLATEVASYKECKPMTQGGRFNAEAWIRIGEYHFDENQLGAAIAAYQRVLDLGAKDNPYYDEALYKLAWTYYRADGFAESIQHFDNLVVYADEEYERTGKAGSEMRPEAIQYLGISFAEEDWDADQQPDAQTGLQRIDNFYRDRGKEKHVYEVYRRLGDIYFDTTKYDAAIDVYKLLLERWPYNPDNPDVQDRTILALERLRDFEKAMAERTEFTRLFGKGSEWEKRNRNNPEALKKARDYDEQALIQAAVFHHKRGQDLRTRGLALKDVKLLQEAGGEYAIAAKAYEKYLERFPNSKNSYEIRYSYASCLFFSQRFPEAADQYALVRDSNLDNRYQEEAAFSATKANEQHLKTQLAKNEIQEPPLPSAEMEQAEKIEMPEAYRNWQASLDAYVKALPNSPKSARLAYKAAEISYRFIHFDDARPRFTVLYDQYCKDPMAVNAGQAVLVTYQLQKDLDQMQAWATKLSSGKCGGDAAAGEVRAGARQLLVGIEFKRAEGLFSQAENLYKAGQVQEAAPIYDQAAAAYMALVDSSPDSSDADKALYNAGVAYEKSMRFESATRIYERMWQKYPNSTLAGEALWRSAENYKRFFEFDKAVNNYLIMADAKRFAASEHRMNAVYNAAVILENDQDYKRAAKLFLRYAQQVGKPSDAAGATFRAGLIYEKMKDYNQMSRVLGGFPQRYGAVDGQQQRAVEALFRIARAAEKRNKPSLARKYYGLTIKEFQARRLQPASDGAEYAAHSEFQHVEDRLESFLARDLKTKTLKALVARKKRLESRALVLKAEYDGILKYKRARWTLGAMQRHGVIYEHVARAVAEGFRELPLPKRVKRLGQEATDIYMEQLDQALEREVRPLEDKTKQLYTMCVDRAKQLGVSNKYTEEARRRLNALDPGAYPLLKAPKVEMALD